MRLDFVSLFFIIFCCDVHCELSIEYMFSAYSELIVNCASSELTIINLKQFGGSGFDDISYRYSPLSTIFSIIRERETRSTTGAVARHAMDIPCNLSSKRKSISQTLHGKATQVYEIYLFFFSSVYPCNRLASLSLAQQ